MTTELIEPKQPIRIDVIQKQYKNGMQLDELARLYDVDEETLRPIVADIVPKKRKKVREGGPTTYTTADLRDLCKRLKLITSIQSHLGLNSKEQTLELLDIHGLAHLIKTKEDVLREKYEKIVKALESGLTHKEVARELKVTTNIVRFAINHLGRDDLKKREGTSPEEYKKLADQVNQMADTMTNSEIKTALGITQNQLSKIRRDYDVKPAKRVRSNQFNPSMRPCKPKPPKEELNVTKTAAEPMDFQELSDRIKRLFELGMTTSRVIEETGISRATYYRVKESHGKEWTIVDGRKERHKQTADKKKTPKAKKAPDLIYPLEPKEEPTMPEVTTASLESAVTAFKAEEMPEVIGQAQAHHERTTRIEQRVLNRDKAVWGDYLSARSEEIEDVTHNVEVVVENGKLIERTTIAYTLERELGR